MSFVCIKKSEIEDMYIRQRMTAEQISRVTGLSKAGVVRRLEVYGIPRTKPNEYEHLKTYGVWNRRTGEFVAMGTVKELMKLTGLKRNSFYSYVSTQKKGIERGRYVIMRMDDEEDDDE